MRLVMRQLTFIVALAFAALLLASACGGRAGELTLEEYFPEVRAIVDEFQEERGELVIEKQAQEADGEAAETKDFLSALVPVWA